MGRNEAQRLADGGIATRKPGYTSVAIDDIEFAANGHALHHPREHLPVDRDLVDSIKGGFRSDKPILVYEDGIREGRQHLLLVAGSRRTNAGRVAQAELRADGKLPPTPGGDDRLFVPIRIVSGGYAIALRERLRENSDPLKLPDVPSVLYATFAQLVALGVESADIEAVAPKGCDVLAILRWPALDPAVQARFDAEPIPPSIIDALADVAPADQAALLDLLLANGDTTARKARRAVAAATGRTKATAPRPATAKAIEAMRGAVNGERAPVADLLAYLTGNGSALRESAPKVAAMLDAAWVAASKPGKRAARA